MSLNCSELLAAGTVASYIKKVIKADSKEDKAKWVKECVEQMKVNKLDKLSVSPVLMDKLHKGSF